jgi:hypothetical protein
MPDGAVTSGLGIVQAGRQALNILKANPAGNVSALFDHSFYIEFDQSWVCVGGNSLSMGPLNIRSTAPEGTIWETGGLQIGDPVTSLDGRLQVGQNLVFTTANVGPWDPPAPPPWTVRTLKSGLKGLNQIGGTLPDTGLAAFVVAPPDLIPGNRVAATARPSIALLSKAVEDAVRGLSPKEPEVEDALVALLGLGPGLTPSGDDFFCGMMITLAILPAPTLHTHLRDVIERHGPQRTNAISLAHLCAAGDGAGHEALHEILNCLVAGDTSSLPERLTAIDFIGHSSGWDALAGISLTLRAYLAAQEIRSRSGLSTKSVCRSVSNCMSFWRCG